MSNLGHSDHEKTRTVCVVNSLLFNILMFDIDNFAGKFPAKNSLSIAHSIDDFLMPHCLTRFITNVENFLSGRFLQSDSASRYDMIKLRIYFEYVLEKNLLEILFSRVYSDAKQQTSWHHLISV